MIEETQRVYAKCAEESLDIDQGGDLTDNKDLGQVEKSFDTNLPQESEVKMNRFFIELFICSLLLWSLLFMSQSSYGKQVTGIINNILQHEIQNEQIQLLVEALEEAVKQIL